ncbi:MAG: hypothetical protein ABSA06_15085 [Geobacteraceae bacterium]|jgi:hypothetical protein
METASTLSGNYTPKSSIENFAACQSLRAMGIDQRLGGVSRRTSIPDLIDEFHNQTSTKN